MNLPTSLRPVIYLAGAIRDGNDADIEWRHNVIRALYGHATFLNPLGGKTYDPETKEWWVSRIPTRPGNIVKQDLWCVRRADIVLANFESLADGYPSIGTVMEYGAAAALNKLLYAIVRPDTPDLANAAFPLHPFLSELSTEVFPSVGAAIDYFRRHLGVLSGTDPFFDGVLDCPHHPT